MILTRLNESNYREFNRQDYRDYSCDEFSDGSKPLIHKSLNGLDTILYPIDEMDNTVVAIHYITYYADRDYMWSTKSLSKSDALKVFKDIIDDIDRVDGTLDDILTELSLIGQKYHMSSEIVNL